MGGPGLKNGPGLGIFGSPENATYIRTEFVLDKGYVIPVV